MTDTAAPTAAEAPAPPGGSGPARLLGLLLLAPAAAMLAVSYIVPTVWTIRTSFRGEDGTSEPIGDVNYARLSEIGYADTFAFAASVMILPVLTVSLVALLIAYLANRAGRFARWLVRLALVLPMVALAPTAFAAGWRLDRLNPGAAATPESAQALIRGAVALTMFGLLVGVGVTVYLAALNRRDRTAPGAAALVVGLIAAMATVAVGLQLYSYPTVLTGGGPGQSTSTPLLTMFRLAFVHFDVGAGAAAATLLLAVLAALGVLAVLVVIVTGLRIEAPPRRNGDAAEEPPGGRTRPVGAAGFRGTKAAARHAEAVIGTFLLLLVVLAVTGYGLWPWLSRLLQFRTERAGTNAAQLLLNTWLPPLIGVVIGMVAAVLAGFAIGALRPLGRFSPLLLLVFAPWLFVGNGVLSLYEFQRLQDAGAYDSFLSLIPPGWVVVPAVVVFTLLFRGQEARWRELRSTGVGSGAATARALILPALPMFWLIGAATWLVQAQSLIWNQIVGGRPDHWSGPTGLLAQLTPGQPDALAVGLVLPFVVIIAMAAGLALLQVTYLDRLVIRVGHER